MSGATSPCPRPSGDPESSRWRTERNLGNRVHSGGRRVPVRLRTLTATLALGGLLSACSSLAPDSGRGEGTVAGVLSALQDLEQGRGAREAPDATGPASPHRQSEDPDPEPPPEVMESEILEKRRGGHLDGNAPPIPVSGRPAISWDQGPRLDAFDGDLALVAGGRLHLDGSAFSQSAAVADRSGASSGGFELRRAYLELGAVLFQELELRCMVDLARETSFRDVFVGGFSLFDIGSIRAGYFKEPFGLEELTSSNDITFLERSLTNALVPGRNLGVLTYAPIGADRRATIALGAFREMDDELERGEGHAFTTRFTGLPVYEERGERMIHLGASFSHRTPSDDVVRFASRPESADATILVDTGSIPAKRELRFGLEAAGVLGPFSLQAEYVGTRVETTGGARDPYFSSWYLQGSWVLTGERRSYRRNVGAFGRVHPDELFGAVELTARCSWIDLDSGSVHGGVLQDTTLGTNWYFTRHARILLNYVLAQVQGVGDEHIGMVRFQLNF